MGPDDRLRPSCGELSGRGRHVCVGHNVGDVRRRLGENRLRSQIQRLTAEGVPARFDHSLCGRGADGRPSRHAIIGATLIIAAAVVVADVDSGSAAGSLLIVFAPLWLASAGLLGRR